jgi:hypothetical protein
MDALDFFLVRYHEFHRSLWDDATKGLSEAQLRGRPHSNANTIVWLVWHTLASTVSSSTVSRCSTRVAGSIT